MTFFPIFIIKIKLLTKLSSKYTTLSGQFSRHTMNWLTTWWVMKPILVYLMNAVILPLVWQMMSRFHASWKTLQNKKTGPHKIKTQPVGCLVTQVFVQRWPMGIPRSYLHYLCKIQPSSIQKQSTIIRFELVVLSDRFTPKQSRGEQNDLHFCLMISSSLFCRAMKEQQWQRG